MSLAENFDTNLNVNLTTGYLDYCRDVLGIKEIILPRVSNKTRFVEISFIVDGTIQNNPQAFDLLNKMILAMRLPISSYEIYYTDNLMEYFKVNSRITLAFGIEVLKTLKSDVELNRGDFIVFNDSNLIWTFSPSHLLENAEDKKIVWADLQKIMKYLT